jgi:hypothetical protein
MKSGATTQPKKGQQQSVASQKEELINSILILQTNILRFQNELETEKKVRLDLFKEFEEATGKRFVKNERRYNKLPEELKQEVKPDPGDLHASLREAYAQDSKILMEKTILKVEESKNAAKLEKHLQICR